jgi:uncharacterized membrane protein
MSKYSSPIFGGIAGAMIGAVIGKSFERKKTGSDFGDMFYGWNTIVGAILGTIAVGGGIWAYQNKKGIFSSLELK